MFEELIAKIETLKRKKRLYGWGHISTRKQGYNDGINSAIRVIKKAMPQPQDKPDKPGVWWKSNYTTPGFHAVLVDETCRWYTEFSGTTHKVEVADWCKWIKAFLVPKETNSDISQS